MPDNGSTDLFYGFYGLAFFVLGAAVAARAAPLPHSTVKLRILALAAFGLLHGFYVWTHMAGINLLDHSTPVAHYFVCLSSSLFLFYFALGAGGRVTAIASGAIALGLVVWVIIAATLTNVVMLEVATYWGFAVPAALAAGFAFLADKSLRGQDEKAQRLSRLSAGVMFIYAGLQLFVTPADFFPATIFNDAVFEAVTGVPAMIARGLCGLILIGTALMLLNSFDDAIRNAAVKALKTVEARLRANELMIRAGFDFAPIGLVVSRIDDATVIEANPEFWRIIGSSPKPMSGRDFREMTPARYRLRDSEGILELEETGRLSAYEKEYRRKDGVAVPVRIEGVRLQSYDSEDLCLSVIQDISVQKQSEIHLRAQQRLAEQANIAKSQFMANMSHELRTPLNGVLGMLELISRQELGEKSKRYVGIAQTSGQALLKLVEDLLDFETLSSGKASITPADFTLYQLYDSAIAPLEAKAAEKRLDFHYESSTGPAFRGDVNRIGQVLSNVLGNAVKFTETGRVAVRMSPGHGGEGVRIEVEDSGIGMSKAFAERAFDRFTQHDASATRSHEGVGLGLSISKGLVEAMGGAISLASEPGQGTTVTIDLPLPAVDAAEQSDSALTPAQDAPKLSRTHARILVAEDNAMNRETIAAMLDGDRFELVFAENGAEAVDLAFNDNFDLMILDIQMPIRSGEEVLRIVRKAQAAGNTRPIPAIACTANAYEDQHETYRNSGFDAVITKPIDLTTLEAEVERLLAA